jgi:glycosyltransferase involved in cell wall biosynthesis
LLIVNDGTLDKSVEIAETFNDSRIKIFNKKNGGLSDARNYGLERAKGEYVYFMDSDDWIEPNLLKECIDLLEKDQLSLVIFGYFQDNENKDGEPTSSTLMLPDIDKLVKSDNNNIISSQLLGLLGYAWNKVYKRSLLVDNALFFEKGTSLVEDIIFNTQVYGTVNELTFIKKGFYHYLNRPIVTLIKQFHHNSFELKVRKDRFLEKFFNQWDVKNKNELLAYSIVQGVRYCVHNLFFFKNNLTYQDKKLYVKMMLNNARVQKYVRSYKTGFNKDLVYKIMIEYKKYRLLTFLASKIK